jgi:hypothetical protein
MDVKAFLQKDEEEHEDQPGRLVTGVISNLTLSYCESAAVVTFPDGKLQIGGLFQSFVCLRARSYVPYRNVAVMKKD